MSDLEDGKGDQTETPRTKTLAIIAGVGAIVGSIVIGHGDCGPRAPKPHQQDAATRVTPTDAPIDVSDASQAVDSN